METPFLSPPQPPAACNLQLGWTLTQGRSRGSPPSPGQAWGELSRCGYPCCLSSLPRPASELRQLLPCAHPERLMQPSRASGTSMPCHPQTLPRDPRLPGLHSCGVGALLFCLGEMRPHPLRN